MCVSLVLSRVASLELWDVFCELFMFCCLLLDHKLAKEAGNQTKSSNWLSHGKRNSYVCYNIRLA